MIKMSVLNRIILLLTGHLAGYQIINGINGYDVWSMVYYTVAFGVLLLACLLLMIFGFEILNSISVVIVATLIPLSLSLGIISEYFPGLEYLYLFFSVMGLILIFFTRISKKGKTAIIALASVHGIAGIVIVLLPVITTFSGTTGLNYLLVAVGGALIGIAGLILMFIKLGKNILQTNTIYVIFPTLLLITTLFFVLGMKVW